jgi:RibD C-terminal domain
MVGGTTFTFARGGVAAALEQARAAAGDHDVAVAGGANVVQQFIAAGLVDELHLLLAPVLIGAGERLFEDVGDPVFEPVEVWRRVLDEHTPLPTSAGGGNLRAEGSACLSKMRCPQTCSWSGPSIRSLRPLACC